MTENKKNDYSQYHITKEHRLVFQRVFYSHERNETYHFEVGIVTGYDLFEVRFSLAGVPRYIVAFRKQEKENKERLKEYKGSNLENYISLRLLNDFERSTLKRDHLTPSFGNRELRGFVENMARCGVKVKETTKNDSGKDVISQRDINEIWKEAVDGVIYTLAENVIIEDSEFEEVDIDELKEDFITCGYRVDEDLKIFCKAKAIIFSDKVHKHKNHPKRIMPYNDNGIFLSPTKGGKTSLLDRVSFGQHIDNASSPALLGYSTAEKVRLGEIDGFYRPIVIDDFQKLHEFSLKKLPSILELGINRNVSGFATVETRTISTFVFCGNTPQDREGKRKEDFMNNFREYLRKFGEALGFLGSRFATIYYNPKGKPAEKIREFSSNDETVVVSLMKQYLEKHHDKIEVVFNHKKVQAWLNEKIPHYGEEINRVLNTSRGVYKIISQFYLGHCDAYRHIKGFALKLSIYENLAKFRDFDKVSDEFIDHILEKAEDCLTLAQKINLDSLKRIIHDSDYMNETEDLITTFSTLLPREKLLVLSQAFRLPIAQGNTPILGCLDNAIDELDGETFVDDLSPTCNDSKDSQDRSSKSNEKKGDKNIKRKVKQKQKTKNQKINIYEKMLSHFRFFALSQNFIASHEEKCSKCPLLQLNKSSYLSRPRDLKKIYTKDKWKIIKANEKLSMFGVRLEMRDDLYIGIDDISKFLNFLKSFKQTYCQSKKWRRISDSESAGVEDY